MVNDRPWLAPTAALAAILALAGVFILGRATANTTSSATRPGIQAVGGIPVGVQDTRAGALAAADNYILEAAQTEEQNPPLFERFVRTVYLPARQQAALTQAAQNRAKNPLAARDLAAGGKGIGFVGARRLDSYSPKRAQVTSYTTAVSWGPLVRPAQGWALIVTRLAWSGDRWLIDGLDASPAQPPVPAQFQVAPAGAKTAAAFDSALQGMTTPFFGTGDR